MEKDSSKNQNGHPQGTIKPQTPKAPNNSFVRFNGWSLPLNSLQVLSWVVIVYFAFIHFAILSLSVNQQLQPVAYVCIGGTFIVVLFLMVWATTINPGDDNSIQRMKTSNKPLPAFDRSIHPHVIENNYCHICEVSVGPLSKHCIACNKCVAVFDHHCNWLNNCVGEKNYKIFIGTLVLTLLTCIGMLILGLFVFINTLKNSSNLNMGVWWKSSSQSRTACLVLIGIADFILIVVFFLVGHLLLFHIYLIYSNLTTYEYVKRKSSPHDSDLVEAVDIQQPIDIPNIGSVCPESDVVEMQSRNAVPAQSQMASSSSSTKGTLPDVQ